jgi:hypothetical protein
MRTNNNVFCMNKAPLHENPLLLHLCWCWWWTSTRGSSWSTASSMSAPRWIRRIFSKCFYPWQKTVWWPFHNLKVCFLLDRAQNITKIDGWQSASPLARQASDLTALKSLVSGIIFCVALTSRDANRAFHNIKGTVYYRPLVFFS